jgi:hypothetical protein
MMSEMLFYEKVVALNDQAHGQLKVKPTSNFLYAAKTNSIPLLVTEFFECAREYPIVFVQAEEGPVPAALVGLRDAENLFVDAEGKWDARYIPAFVRRYPFVPGKGDQGQLIVCIDEDAPCFGTTEGDALFADGKPAAPLEHAIKFLTEFHQVAAETQRIGQRLQSLGLLKAADSQARMADGREFRLQGLFVVDEAKLRALDKDQVQTLFADGILGLVYAQLLSMGSLSNLIDRMSRRLTAAEATEPAPTKH